MLRLLGETWIAGWMVATALAVRWHHVLTTGSQRDFERVSAEEAVENVQRTFALNHERCLSADSGVHIIEQT